MLPPSVGKSRLAAFLAVAGFTILSPVARGEEPPSAVPVAAQAETAAEQAPPADLAPRVQQLEEQIRKLQEMIQRLLEEKAAAGKPVAPADVQKMVDEQLKKHSSPLAGWQDGFFLQSPDGDFRLRLRGYLQSDTRTFTSSGDTGADSFFLRRVRPIFEGRLYKNFDFRIMPDFGGGTTVLQDAYLDVKYWPPTQLRLGKFKEPFSLERLQSGSELLFIERSIANNLAPNRDVGVQLFGDVVKGTLTYQLGYFNGVVDSASSDGDVGDDKDLVARVFAQPFKAKTKSPLQGLGVGVAVTTGKRDELLTGVNLRTAGRSTFFRYDATVAGAGTQTRWTPQLYYFGGPFGLMGEYVESRVKVREAAARGDLTHSGWYLQGSYVLTGEKPTYRQVTPARPFDPKNNQWGAFELAFRYGKVTMDRDTFTQGFADPAISAREATAYTFGLNWYLTRAVKAQFNYERTDFDHAIRFGTDTRDHEDVFLTRFQLAY
jgi:phosphate-selective porin OprO/OprP